MYLGVHVDKVCYQPALIALPVLCLLIHPPCDGALLPSQGPFLNGTFASGSNRHMELELKTCVAEYSDPVLELKLKLSQVFRLSLRTICLTQ